MPKKPKAVRLGIDFGTTRTVVAAAENGNYPLCTFSLADEVKEYIPTLAAVEKGRLFFGWEAAGKLREPGVFVLRSTVMNPWYPQAEQAGMNYLYNFVKFLHHVAHEEMGRLYREMESGNAGEE